MKSMFFVLMLALSTISFADDDMAIADFAAADSNEKDEIDEIIEVCGVQSHSPGDIAYLLVCDGSKRVSKNGCSNGQFIAWDLSKGQGTTMYSTALTALVAEKEVMLRLDGSSCLVYYDKTSMIRIRK